MSKWGKHPEQSDEPPHVPHLVVAVSCVAGAVAFCLVDAVTPWHAPSGVYAILIGFAVGAWLRRDTMLLRRQVVDLTREVRQLRTAHRAGAPGARHVGRSAIHGMQEYTVPLMPRVDSRRLSPIAERDLYWRVYTDVLEDLSGAEREPPSPS